MAKRPDKPHRATFAVFGQLAVVLCLWAAGLAAATLATSATTATAGTVPCASQPNQATCTLTAVSVQATSLATCATSCTGSELDVGDTAQLELDGVYNDGSEGPLLVVAGSGGPKRPSRRVLNHPGRSR